MPKPERKPLAKNPLFRNRYRKKRLAGIPQREAFTKTKEELASVLEKYEDIKKLKRMERVGTGDALSFHNSSMKVQSVKTYLERLLARIGNPAQIPSLEARTVAVWIGILREMSEKQKIHEFLALYVAERNSDVKSGKKISPSRVVDICYECITHIAPETQTSIVPSGITVKEYLSFVKRLAASWKEELPPKPNNPYYFASRLLKEQPPKTNRISASTSDQRYLMNLLAREFFKSGQVRHAYSKDLTDTTKEIWARLRQRPDFKNLPQAVKERRVQETVATQVTTKALENVRIEITKDIREFHGVPEFRFDESRYILMLLSDRNNARVFRNECLKYIRR